MSSVVIKGDTSGQVTLTVPAIAGTNTATLPAGTGTIAVQGASTNIVSGTAVASTSGTSIDFTSIPSWVKRITVVFNGVSLSGTANFLIQLGSGSVTTSGYTSTGNIVYQASTYVAGTQATNGFVMYMGTAANSMSGSIVLHNITGNTWISNHIAKTFTNSVIIGAGDVSLSGSLDRVRVTTVNGTDTFDAGSINILYE
jgi:hypothetical protein